MSPLARALTAELIGTFALVFIGAGAGALGVGGLVGVAFAHGLVVLGLVYAYGHLSGTHINPVVTLGVLVAGKIEPGHAVAYVVAQLVGGILGALALAAALGGMESGLGVTVLAEGVTPVRGFLIEAILTFFLVNAVLNAGVSGKASQIAGIAIGLTLTSCILMGGPLTGAGLNPARTLGPGVISGNLADVWVYLAGPALGALAAAILYRDVLEER